MDRQDDSELGDISLLLAGPELVRPQGLAATLVSFELIEPREPFVTNAAAEPVLLRVDGHVLRQMSSVFEALRTHGAAERSLSRVDPHVDAQVVLAAEHLPALGAAE